MGDYRVTIEALGSHGCQRDRGDGEFVVGCETHNCPDCIAREYVRRLKRAGQTVKRARIEHWPADVPGNNPANSVTDDLLSGRRAGAFPEHPSKR